MKKTLVIFIVLMIGIFSFSEVFLNIETIEKNNEKYFVYELSPEFSLGPITLGIGFTAYSTDVINGKMYYGLPTSVPSTNLINAFVINTFGLKTDFIDFRYGKAKPISLAMGYNVRKYLKPNTRAFDISVYFNNLGFYTHIPYELTKYVPFEFSPSDSVFIANIGYDLGLLNFGSYLLTDIEATKTYTISSATPVKYAGGVSIYIPILNILNFGIEAAIQTDEDLSSIAKGFFAGIYGDLDIFNPIAGVYYAIDGFTPFLFNKSYSNLKYDNNLPGISDKDKMIGYLAGTDIDLEPYGSGELYLYGTFDSTPTAEGNVKVKIPEFDSFAGLFIDFYYYDNTPFENKTFLDENTESYLRILYPLIGENFTAGIQYEWNKDKWFKSIFVGGINSF